nr:VWA domain-containing protein [Aestuariicella hydrocarbonica]
MLCLWTLALAGPSWQQEAPPWVDDQSPLVIVLHLGNSMLTKDRQPDRLTLAKTKINQMLADRSGGATALVVYRGSAHSVLPLTEDTGVLKYYLQDLQPEVLPVEGNRPDLALQKSAQLLRGQGGSVVLVTDSLDGFVPLQRDWNPFADRGQPEQAAVQVMALLLVPDPGVADQLAAAEIERVTVTADDSDLQSLSGKMDRQWQQQLQADDSLQWRDNGYYLLWPLLLVAMLWFRRGMVLPW